MSKKLRKDRKESETLPFVWNGRIAEELREILTTRDTMQDCSRNCIPKTPAKTLSQKDEMPPPLLRFIKKRKFYSRPKTVPATMSAKAPALKLICPAPLS